VRRYRLIVQPIASPRHTIILLAILTVLSLATSRANTPGATPDRVILYASVIGGELLLLRYVSKGLRGLTLTELIGRRTLIDVVIAAAFWFGARYLLFLLRHTIGLGDDHTSHLLPSGIVESVLWIGASITAGLVEEVVFRGYLQRQFAAWCHSIVAGVILQAIMFGAAHGYQGVRSMSLIAVYGLMFGVLAWWRRSLVPGILAHGWTDIFSGLSQ
jgi:membrane protease YdiL (CAAX protease family)